MTRDTELRREVIILKPGEGRKLPGPEGITFKATAETTAGAIAVLEATSDAGFGPPRHIHHSHDEWFYVIDGTFQFLAGEGVYEAPAGSFVFIPRGTVHAPKVAGDRPATVVFGFVPGGAEASFIDFAGMMANRAAGEDGLDADEAQEIARRYDSEFVGPPL